MGDHRMSIKIQAEFHGIKRECDMYINWYPTEYHEINSGTLDNRVIEFFTELVREGLEVYNDRVYEYKKKLKAKLQEENDKKEYERLKIKYEHHQDD